MANTSAVPKELIPTDAETLEYTLMMPVYA